MNSQNVRRDVAASVVVFFVAVPLCLGIAVTSGASVISGLLAGIIGGIVVGVFSGSQLGVSGPAAGLATIVLAAIGDLGFEVFLSAVVLAGILQILMGLAKGGFIAHFFPSSVIKGMLAGIGISIFLKQLPNAFGYDRVAAEASGNSMASADGIAASVSRMFEHADMVALTLAAVSLAILIFWERVVAPSSSALKRVPGPLLVVALGIVFQAIAASMAPEWALNAGLLVSVPVGEGQGILSNITTPDWSEVMTSGVLVTAATIALVASLETLLCVEATDKLDPQKRVTPTNRELVAQGVGNTLSGLVGGLPITQVIVRSSSNIQSGGRTKMSAILHGVLLLIFATAFPELLNLIPLSVLAAVLLVVGYKLAKPSLFKAMYTGGWMLFIPFITTIAGIVLKDLLVGIGLGLTVAILNLLYRSYSNSHLMHMPQSDSGDMKKTVHLRLAEEVTFLNRGAIVRELAEVPDGSHVIIDRSETRFMDEDVVEVIEEFKTAAAERNITVDVVDRSGNTGPEAASAA